MKTLFAMLLSSAVTLVAQTTTYPAVRGTMNQKATVQVASDGSFRS